MQTALPKERKWIRYLWLIYLVFALFPLILSPGTTLWHWLLTGLTIAVFLPIYLRAYDLEGQPLLRHVVAIALLGLVSSTINPNLNTLFVYAAAAACRVGSPQMAWRVVLAVMGGVILAAGLSLLINGWYAEIFYFAIPLFFSGFIGALNIYQAERESYNLRLLAAHQENERLATIAERERIARDLHDLLGHTLSVITLKAELATKLAERDPAKAALEMREVERISREATQQVREAVQGYKSRGLQGELASAKLALQAANIQFDYYTEPLVLSPAQESVLALALREAITNIIRHSTATHCAVRLSQSEAGLRLEIEDNGKGGTLSEGSGLGGMRQRIEGLGGTLSVEGSGGTRLSLALPQTKRVPQDDQPVVATVLPGTLSDQTLSHPFLPSREKGAGDRG
jgi:two-component system sensor histidine kinase DesK